MIYLSRFFKHRDFFMVNLNGSLEQSDASFLSLENRGYKYGDAVFETLKVVRGKILFREDHYFRLMASMRILRMEIPMTFTLEFIEDEILKTVEANNLLDATARVRLNVDRGEGGKYKPVAQAVNYNISVERLESEIYAVPLQSSYRADLYKDFFITPGLLSTLKTTNKIINVIGSIYAEENDLDNCLLLNTQKSVIEALNGNLFLIQGTTVKTPPLEDGCLKGVMRQQVIEIIEGMDEYELIEGSISPFEIQKADELFITNVISGIQPITDYRKKQFTQSVSELIVEKLNIKIRLSS